MKKIVGAAYLLALCFAQAQCSQRPSPATGQSIRAPMSFEVTDAVNHAQEYLDTFLSKATQKQKDAFGAFLKTYKSWYQSVTPASQQVVQNYRNLPVEAHEAMGAIRAIADQFTSEPVALAGGSRLSSDGNEYYQALISQFNMQRSKPRPDKVY
jgi:predicted AAA+ superfamily ATPase